MSLQYPDGLVPFGPNANCTVDLCPVEWSTLQYQPTVALNVGIMCAFTIFISVQSYFDYLECMWEVMFMNAGFWLFELFGYAARIHLSENPFSMFSIQSQDILIISAPVFYSAAIHFLIRRFTHVEPSVARAFPRIFIDEMWLAYLMISLMQIAGASQQSSIGPEAIADFTSAMLNVGLWFHAVAIGLTMALCVRCAYQQRTGSRAIPPPTPVTFVARRFAVFVALACLAILLRTLYRIFEVNGYIVSAYFMKSEIVFMVLEGWTMCMAILFLILGHPGNKIYAAVQQPVI